MEFWKITFANDFSLVEWEWYESEKEAQEREREILEDGATLVFVERVKIPERKDEMLEWLRTYAVEFC